MEAALGVDHSCTRSAALRASLLSHPGLRFTSVAMAVFPLEFRSALSIESELSEFGNCIF